MNSLRTTLTVLGAVFAAALIPTLWAMIQQLGSQRQTGVGAVAGGVSGLLLSPVFWVLAPLFFFFFLRMSKVRNEADRILFFWIPTVAATSIGLLFVAGLTYLFLHSRY